METRIAFIENDLPMLRALMETIRLQPAILCVLGTSSVESFWAEISDRAKLDFIFLDIDLPGQSGIDAIPALRKRFPEADIIMLTQFEESDKLFKALHAGASGYLIKGFPLLQLPQLIHAARQGEALISPTMARKLIQYFNPVEAADENLTPKETQVLKLIADGNSYQEVADMMGLTVDGIKYHIKNIYRKLHVSNKIEAIQKFKNM